MRKRVRRRPACALVALALVLAGPGSSLAGEAEVPREVIAHEADALAAERSGDLPRALQRHTAAIERAEALGHPHLVAVLFNRLGQTLEAANRVQEAVVAYESGLRALRREPGLDVEGVLGRLGLREKTVGSGPASPPLDLYSEALDRELDAAARDPALVVKLLVNVGNAYARQPQDSPALQAYDLALARPEIATEPSLRARVLANMGQILRRIGDTDRAAARLTEALALMRRHMDPVEARRVMALLAGIQRDRGQVEGAAATYQDALALYARAGDPRGEGRAYAGLGRLELERRRFAEARAAFERAVERARATRDDEVLWYAYWGLGRARRALGDLDGAAEALELALRRITTWRGQLATDEGKVTFLEGARDVMDQLIDVHLVRAVSDPRRYADALAVAEDARGRALADLMGGGRRAFPYERARARPASCSLGSPADGGIPEISPAMPSGGPAADAARRRASQSPAQVAPGIPSGSPLEEAEAPPPVVEPPSPPPAPLTRLVFHVLDDRTAVFVVGPDGAVRGEVVRLGREALARRLDALRRALGVDAGLRGLTLAAPASGIAPTAIEPAEIVLDGLYRDLVAPVEAWLPPEGSPLVLEPHDALWLLPFAAVRTLDGRWFGDRWPLLYSPSAAALEAIRRQPGLGSPARLDALVVGNPIPTTLATRWGGLDLRFDPLVGAETEALRIGDLVAAERRRVLLGPDGSLERVVSDMHRYGIVHLATHGIASAEDPLSSFIVLGPSRCGQLLTAREVTALSLRADLVVLSACQTGLGKITGDGMIGLSRAFLVAGARTVIVSQWSVSDGATAELMIAFYRHYLRDGMDKATAMQRAMREVRNRPGYADPRYWAPFVVIGAES